MLAIGIWFPITKGKFALVDREMYETVTKHRWTLNEKHVERVVRNPNGQRSTLELHRFILGLEFYDGIEVDHENRDALDCRRGNLRKCNRSQNQANRGKLRKGQSIYKGVTYVSYKEKRYWRAHVRVNHELIYLGTFPTEIDAAKGYDEAARKYFGEFAYRNFEGSTS